MIGMLYKDIRTNRSILFLIFGVAIFLNAMSFVAITMDDEESMSRMPMFLFGYTALFAACTFMIVGAFALNFIQADERKKWGYYVSSLPGGIAKQVIEKYVFIACSLMFAFGMLWGLNFIHRKLIDDVPDNFGLLVALLGFSLIMRSIELPCVTAFGTKVGTQIKGGMMAVIVLALVIYGLFGDLSWIGSEKDFWDSFFKLLSNFSFKGLGVKLLAVGAPMYCISCFISTKVYLMGVDRLEK